MADAVFRIQDDYEFDTTISLADRAGNMISGLPAGATADWNSSDTSIATVTQMPTDPLSATVATVGPLGNVQINVAVQLPNGGAVLNGILSLEVIAGDATTLKLNPVNIRPRTF